MRKWMLKAVVQKAISFLPGKHRINYLFQKHVTRGVQLSDDYFDDRLIHLREHLKFFEKYKGPVSGKKTLELGTGWYPVIPIGLFLCGADEILTVDISRLTDEDRVWTTLRKFHDYHRQGQLESSLPVDPERLQAFCDLVGKSEDYSLEDLFARLKIRYLVADARRLPLQDDSIDLITSNNTFEHVFPDVLAEILLEFKRVAKPGGLMSHFIDMSDHFAHLDPGITIYNFLKYTERQWKWIDNAIQPQNRWRITHYRDLYRRLGIPISEESNRPGDLKALASVPLAPPFRDIAGEELAVSHGYLVSRIEGLND
jgi:hypothetical protein